MFTVRLLTVSPTRRPFIIEGIDFYRQRLKQFCRFELNESKEPPLHEGGRGALAQAQSRAAEILQSKQNPRHLSVQLDVKGQRLTSKQFARWLDEARHTRTGVDFLLGGAAGLAPLKTDLKLSLGSWTLPHELARLVLVEGIYRAFTIIHGHPYHK
ncbi:23S rRNA (pseudouridine(1915)-N(3))-methyltransferase RlmH [bacterium]|nr:23S rRNA (pseudouridine(1915)-N(3))-methyltransferase RlmH [bacterium]